MRTLPQDGWKRVAYSCMVLLDGLDDSELVERAILEPQAFAGIFDRHASAIHRYAQRRVGADDADDVLMATFAAAFDGRASFTAPSHRSARPWLFGIASNLVKRHYRTRQRGADLRTRLVAERPAESTSTQSIDEMISLATALEQLSDEERETLLLVSLGELTYDETADILGIPVGTVRSRVNRARGRLRDNAHSTQGGNNG